MNKNTASNLIDRIGAFFTATVGRINWTSPPWLQYLRQQAVQRPGRFWSSAVSLIVLLIAMGYGYSWYKNRPQPQRVIAQVTVPKITPIIEDALIPDVLTIDFGFKNPNDNNIAIMPQSVAPLKLIGKPVEHGITLSPALKGEWVWQSDSQLVFKPETDWPAGQTYNIHFDNDVFSADAKMQSYTTSFSTLPFTATISEFTFYQDPVKAQNRQAVATIQFNFPVDTTSLENNTSLLLQALKNGKLNLDAQRYTFNVTYDTFKRTAYLHSEKLTLPEVSRYLLLTLNKDVKSATGSDTLHADVSRNLLIPDAASYFNIRAASASIVRNEQDHPEQVLILESSVGVTEAELKRALHVYALPENLPATATVEEKKNYEWQNPGEVTAAILALSSPLPLKTIPAEENYASLHSFKFSLPTPRYLYLKLDKGTRGFGDVALSQDYIAVIKVPELPKEISFLHKGSLLAFSGEKKLSVLVRGVDAVKFDFARVLPENINQLVTQTEGDFNNPTFLHNSFNQQNISAITSEIQTFNASDLSKPQYTALDFGKYLSAKENTAGSHGLFLLQARGWDTVNNVALEVQANRLVLITDLGLVVKDNQDGSHDVFVQSITDGTPQANVAVSVLGKNGLPLLTYATNEQGRVTFPTLTSYIDEREPVVYLATLNNDLSFIPYRHADRQLNFSRFDIGGVYSNNQEQHHLSAYLFSDRGIYRPGDTAKVGMIVKQAFVMPQPAGLPLQVTVIDPRGVTIQDQMLTLDTLGYVSIDVPTQATSATGPYQVSLYTVKDKHAESLIGFTTLRVQEFQPDRMRIKSTLSQKSTEGWISPLDLGADVQLMNLYGAPATDRQVNARLLLQPKAVEFKSYPDYHFFDPLVDPKKPAKVLTDDLSPMKTNDKGEASFHLNLERFEKATYQLTFFAEGFEAEGGRSVATQSTALVSPLPYFVGYHADGDLKFIQQNGHRSLKFIAINPQLKQQAVDGLTLQLVALTPVSTLVKKPDGTYQYQSIIQTKVLSTSPFNIKAQGTLFDLPTKEIGDFAVNIVDKDHTELSHVAFTIVGASQRPLAKNAELDVKINQETYHAGDDIQLQITAPYTGSGLITIERDKVYATQWFKSSTTSSVQTIHIPNDFQGNGYVNVTFVRDWNSPDIFISPLSFSVVPFSIDNAAHDVQIDLDVPERARPGEPFTMTYHTDKPGKIVVFAVDEGILQVANYQTPDPLAFFFQKQALEVLTQQTVDQILPQFIQARELSAVGGDGGEALLAAHLNPFKRKTDLPVAYWSGIVDTDTTPRQLTYDVPNYFNGTLHVMAVAVALDAVGATDKQAEVRGDFVINPNTPTFVAPGDEFEITASIANNLKDSGADANVAVELNVSPELEVLGSSKETVAIGEGHEQTVRFKLRAHATLGSATTTFTARIDKHSASMDATLSVRPANPFYTAVTSGHTQQTTLSVSPLRELYPEYRLVDAAMSSSPLILVAGLQRYLENFPYGCTEQLTSQAFPLLAMTDKPWFAMDTQKMSEKIIKTFQMLGQRQMSNGGFSYWPGMGENNGNMLASVYAMHFLTEARAQGYQPSNDLFNGGLRYLQEVAGQNAASLDMARIQAYAIYLLTRNEMVTTNYLTNLQLYLDKENPKGWQSDLTGAYIASTYQLLKNQTEANRLIAQFKPQAESMFTTDFYDSNIANAQYLYLVARHFPERLPAVGDALVLELVTALNRGEINTLLSSYTSLALGAYSQSVSATQDSDLSISELLADNQSKTLATILKHYGTAKIDENATQVVFGNPKQQPYFYQLTQAGFDKTLPTKAIQEGLEIEREYRDKNGNAITTTTLGTEIEVHIQVRALNNRFINNTAIVDLLPGGFEVVRDSVKTTNIDYADVREDRVVYFGFIDPTAKEIVYRIKAINTGKYTIPPIVAESMYDPATKARGLAGVMTVTQG